MHGTNTKTYFCDRQTLIHIYPHHFQK